MKPNAPAIFDMPLPESVIAQARFLRTLLGRHRVIRHLHFIRRLAASESQGHRLPDLGPEDAPEYRKPEPRIKAKPPGGRLKGSPLNPAMIAFACDLSRTADEAAAMLGSSSDPVRRARQIEALRLKRIVSSGVFLGHELAVEVASAAKEEAA